MLTLHELQKMKSNPKDISDYYSHKHAEKELPSWLDQIEDRILKEFKKGNSSLTAFNAVCDVQGRIVNDDETTSAMHTKHAKYLLPWIARAFTEAGYTTKEVKSIDPRYPTGIVELVISWSVK